MYPVSYEADFNPAPNRWTTFFRLFLAIPWLLVGIVYVLLLAFTHLFAWVAVIVLGRYPDWLYDFNSGALRYLTRFSAFAYLQTDAWPPFGIAEEADYPIRLRIAPPAESQSRLKALFRLILVLPIAVVVYAIGTIHSGLAVVAWLTIVFRGYLPRAVFDAMTFVNGLYARVGGYTLLLTDDYPPIGVEATKASADQAPATPPPAAPPEAV